MAFVAFVACLAHVTNVCLRGVKLRPSDAEALCPHLPALKDLELHLCPYFFIRSQQQHLAGTLTANCPKLFRLRCTLTEYWDVTSVREELPSNHNEAFGEKAHGAAAALPGRAGCVVSRCRVV